MSGVQKRTVGVVVGDRMDKTAVVAVERTVLDPRYRKYVRRSKKYKVHDPRNEAKVGDRVEIAECRPISKTKAWRLVRILGADDARQVHR